MPNIEIRAARESDADMLHQMVVELATYERAADEVRATVADIRESLFGADPAAAAFVSLLDGQEVGFALYFFNYSTWLGRRGIYLEDLFVKPEARGHGIGKALLRRLAQRAAELGCERLEWAVLDWNKPAREFYEALGAHPKSDWIPYRLSGDALRDFAGHAVNKEPS